jgi:hypothetical protein
MISDIFSLKKSERWAILEKTKQFMQKYP